MKNYVGIFLSITFSVAGSCLAVPEIYEEDVTIQEIYAKARTLNNQYGAARVGHVVDKDGVLTRTKAPTLQIGPAEPRGHADLVVRYLIDAGTQVVISSAWDSFSTTLKGLREIELAEYLDFSPEGASMQDTLACQNETLRDNILDQHRNRATLSTTNGHYGDENDSFLKHTAQKGLLDEVGCVRVVKSGKVVSCQRFGTKRDPEETYQEEMDFEETTVYAVEEHARAKWLALDFLSDTPSKPKVVCLWDDSPLNLRLFKENMKHARWYPTVEKVYLWKLSDPQGYVHTHDIIDEFQIIRRMEPDVLLPNITMISADELSARTLSPRQDASDQSNSDYESYLVETSSNESFI